MVDKASAKEHREDIDSTNIYSVLEHVAKGSGIPIEVDGKKVMVGVGEENDPLTEIFLKDPDKVLKPIYVSKGLPPSEVNKMRAQADPFFPLILPLFGDEKALELLGQGIAMGIKPGALDDNGRIKGVEVVFKKGDDLIDPPGAYGVRSKYKGIFEQPRIEGKVLNCPVVKSSK